MFLQTQAEVKADSVRFFVFKYSILPKYAL